MNVITQGAEYRALVCKHECNYVWTEFRSIMYMSMNVWAEIRVYYIWAWMWLCMSRFRSLIYEHECGHASDSNEMLRAE